MSVFTEVPLRRRTETSTSVRMPLPFLGPMLEDGRWSPSRVPLDELVNIDYRPVYVEPLIDWKCGTYKHR